MKAIVTGVSGQDGYYMVQKLLEEGYEVLGLTSNLSHAKEQKFENYVANAATSMKLGLSYELTLNSLDSLDSLDSKRDWVMHPNM
jgi:GDP-D-mannose dehydratase